MTLQGRFIIGGLILGWVGCSVISPPQSRYLQTARDRAGQEEVRERLGEPLRVTAMPAGQSEWTYEVYEIEPGSQNTWSTAGSWCDQYILRFDDAGVLRTWAHTSYFHGGELMPRFCNSGHGVQKQAF
jgi:hypothetical protein